jgi:hypothetical protein
VRRLARQCWIPVVWMLATLGLVVAACGSPSAPRPAVVTPLDIPPIEAMPASRLETMAARDQALAAARLEGRAESPMRLQRRTRRWAAGATIKVAFRGGDAALRRRIAEVAALWTLHGNIGFDFGDAGGKGFRAWSPNDTAYTAQIRIGFDDPDHFSCVGDESVNAACAAPGQASMNYAGFDRDLPANWHGIVLHQFGHALGLEHERPAADPGCDAELRWDDDAGYARTTAADGRLARDGAGRWPGIYTMLAGPPHRWNRGRVDQALRRLPESRAFGPGPADPASVMRDDFGAWMFRAGAASRCFAPRAERLSEGDERGMASMYPRVPADVMAAVRRHEAALASIRDAERLAPPIRRFVEGRLDVLQAFRVSAAPR